MADETDRHAGRSAADRLRAALDADTAVAQIDRDVVRLRFGLHDGVPRDRDETGHLLACSVESVRQSELRALETLGLSDLASAAPGKRRYRSLPDGTPADGVVIVGGVRWWRLRDGRWTDGERTLSWWEVYPALGEVARRSPLKEQGDGAAMLDAAFVRRDPMMLAEITSRLADRYRWAGTGQQQAQDNAVADIDEVLSRRVTGPGVVERVATGVDVGPETVIRSLGLAVRQPSDIEQGWELDRRNNRGDAALTLQVDHVLTRPMLVAALARHLHHSPERRDRRAMAHLCASITRADVVAACRAALLAHVRGGPGTPRGDAGCDPGDLLVELERAETTQRAADVVDRLWPRPRFDRPETHL